MGMIQLHTIFYHNIYHMSMREQQSLCAHIKHFLYSLNTQTFNFVPKNETYVLPVFKRRPFPSETNEEQKKNRNFEESLENWQTQ